MGDRARNELPPLVSVLQEESNVTKMGSPVYLYFHLFTFNFGEEGSLR